MKKKLFIAPPSFSLKDIFLDIRLWLAFGFGSGTCAIAPGTMGTIAALLVYCALPMLSPFTAISLWLVALGLSLYLAHYAERKIGISDYKGIVCDEFVGFWVAVFLLPHGWVWLLLAFILFRFFDITKPWPIYVLEKRLPGAFGCVLDDVVAGIYAWLVLYALHWVYTLQN